MGWLKQIFSRCRRYDEIAESIRDHLEEKIEDLMEDGLSHEEATHKAHREFGNATLIEERSREVWQWPRLETLFQDLRFGARMLLKKPSFTLIAVATLALGIGANTAIFSVVNALLLRPLPYAEAERLVLLSETSPGTPRNSASYPNYDDWRDRAQSFEGMAIGWPRTLTLTGQDKAVRVPGYAVNWNFFPLLRVQPQLGRMFTEADDRYGAARTVIISHSFWQRRFGGATTAIGQTLYLTNEAYTVIGVLPPSFEYFQQTDVYRPLSLTLAPDSPFANRGGRTFNFFALARLKPGMTVAQANSEMEAIGRRLAREYPKVNAGVSAQAERLQDVMSESVRSSLWILLGAVGFILLIACVNVANLTLARAAERQKELAVRLALGAGRLRIMRQLLSESLLLAVIGGAGGLLLGNWMLQGLLALAPAGIPQLSRVGMDNSVLLFTLGIAALASVLVGLLPALQASKTDLQTTLKDGGRLTTGASRDRARKALLVSEVGLSLVLLVGAGLLVRSMWNLLRVDPGFNPDNLLTLRIDLAGGGYDNQRMREFYDECLARARALPGARSVAYTHSLPITGSNWNGGFTAADKPAPSHADLPQTDRLRVSPNYFETMGIRLLRGRSFTSADTAESTPVVVVNDALARRIWPNEDPVGKRLKFGSLEDQDDEDKPWREVVGVVNDVKMNGVAQ